MIQNNISKWADTNFSSMEFGDIRREKRLITIVKKLAENPGKKIPQLFSNFYDVKAAYNFFKHPEATPDKIQKQHRKVVLNELRRDGEYLLIEDTSTLTFRGRQKITGLSVTNKNQQGDVQGFLLHSVLAVKWQTFQNISQKLIKLPVEVLGLAHQQYYVRKPAIKKNNVRLGRKDFNEDQISECESSLWSKSILNLSLPKNKKKRYVRICDRGADIYEVLLESQLLNLGFVIRACYNRVLQNSLKLFDYARTFESLGSFTLDLRSRANEKARTVNLNISSCKVSLKSPVRVGVPRSNRPPVNCNIIRVWESNSITESDPIEWFLLCDQEINDFEHATKCTLQYAARWLIEDFHKALKTGLGAEKLQLEGASRLFAAISIMSIVALRLIEIRERFRLTPLAPKSESGLTKLELKVLSFYLNRTLTTITDVNLALGKLGGHLNRKSDGLPGIITLWRGIIKLQSLVEGYKLGLCMKK